MKIKYLCEYCETEFYTENECLEHEEICKLEVSYTCDKCGKSESWKINDDAWIKSENWYNINLGRAGYVSSLDGCEIDFTICDDCLTEYIKSLTLEGREKVFNSGGNKYMADISMCLYKECPKSKDCYRYTAPASQYRQTYDDYKNICNESNNYIHFWDAKRRYRDINEEEN